MLRIQEYVSNERASGTGIPGRRAQPGDFGGPGLMQLGRSIQGAAQEVNDAQLMLKDQQSRDEVTDAHVQIAKANADWSLHLNERANAATPGNETFAPKFLEDLDGHLATLGDRYETPNARRVFELGVANIKGYFKGQAFDRHAALAGVHASNNFRPHLMPAGTHW